jgi:hypothetical protein
MPKSLLLSRYTVYLLDVGWRLPSVCEHTDRLLRTLVAYCPACDICEPTFHPIAHDFLVVRNEHNYDKRWRRQNTVNYSRLPVLR